MDKGSSSIITIRTSSPNWLSLLIKAYEKKASIHLSDDANIGIDPINDTLLDMGRKANLTQREWIAILTGLGIGITGVFLLVAAILDPEPYSKIAIALATSTILILGGGFSTIRVLVGHKPPNIKVMPNGGFEISFN